MYVNKNNGILFRVIYRDSLFEHQRDNDVYWEKPLRKTSRFPEYASNVKSRR